MTFDALIVGGGPAGATTALLLAEAGWSVALIEKKSFPRRKVCGEFMSATNKPLFEKLGIADLYQSYGCPEIKRVGILARECLLSSDMPVGVFGDAPWGRALGRQHLDTMLLEKAAKAGATIWQPWQLISIERNVNSISATISSQKKSQQVNARIVIMANGSWEKSIESIDTPSHKASDLLAFKAHFKSCDLPFSLMPLLVFPGGYGGLVQTDSGLVTLSCCIRRDVLQEARLQYSGLSAGEAVLQHIKTSCEAVRQIFLHAKREGEWLSAGPIRPGIRKRYEKNLFYVGNIAGEAHPVVAEGISMAMQSAWLLSQVLFSHKEEILVQGKSGAAGKIYAKEWKKHFARRIRVASLFAQLAMRPLCVTLLLPFLKRYPALITLGAKWSGKITQVVPVLISTKSVASEKGTAT